uniref:NADH-ubiquinone oxidoreductase chain 1 n=1 Tax=Exallonyx sp. ZJUH_2016014 TaxID=2491158 RepID=A0A3S8V0R3_9HYME|nr:NADH dehydrogenase subunit 1 [Exallonyx sp. ZJUH_2016014]
MFYISVFLIFLINIVMVLVSIAFLTLLERKVLSYIQLRKGPNKLGFIGIFQPFSDAIKLFSNENMNGIKVNQMYYLLSPMFMILLMLSSWIVIPYYYNLITLNLGILYFLCCLSLGVYLVSILGWSSNSVYSIIGSIRSIAQTISYEVSLILLLFSVIIMIESYTFYDFIKFQQFQWFIFMLFPISMMMFVSILSELNRSPFDFSEGESELVSGFNTEYMSGGFALIFMSEYGMIIYLSYIYMLMFMGGDLLKLKILMIMLLMIFLVIWVRGALPRYRYDKLMYMIWKGYLPISLNLLLLMLSYKFMIYMLLN